MCITSMLLNTNQYGLSMCETSGKNKNHPKRCSGGFFLFGINLILFCFFAHVSQIEGERKTYGVLQGIIS